MVLVCSGHGCGACEIIMFAISNMCSFLQVKSNGPNTVKLDISFRFFSTAYGIFSLKDYLKYFC